MTFFIHQSYLIPLLPLLGAIVAGFFGDKYLKGKAHWPIWIGVGCSLLISLILLFGVMAATHDADPSRSAIPVDFFNWISAGSFTATAGFWIDPLTVTMLTIVTGVGLLITIFSAGYMKGEAGYSRFFAYLGLFIFSMTCLVMGSNLLMLYLGWEGVGVCSYLLIGYYYERPAASAAAKKAFIVNRIGDFGFAVGIMLCFFAFHTVSFFGSGVGTHTGLLERARDVWMNRATATAAGSQELWALQIIPFLLMLGAFGKSAQFPLYVWLPDAMEGPTPVSALIHAATMVTAGVYMIVRCGTLFVTNQGALNTITAVGAFTALFAATIALRQFDLKKVFAYSTISQLGYMFVAVGVLAPTAAVFHLLTHAFFKALLFLSSGVVMHAMLGHLDMRKMSGLSKVLPKTNIVMLVGCLALSGFPLFSGFWSKDLIVGQTWSHSFVLGCVLLFTSFLTAYYTFRLYFQVFHGPLLVPTTPADASHPDTHVDAAPAHQATAQPNAPHDAHTSNDHDHHDHEPGLMLWPLYVLAVGALCIGWIIVPGGSLARFLGHSPSLSYAYEMASNRFDSVSSTPVDPVMFGKAGNDASDLAGLALGGLVSVLGIGLAYQFHWVDRKKAEQIAAGMPSVTSILEGKYWIDELYDAMVVEPLRHVGKVFFAIDRLVIDSIVWAIGFVPQLSGFALKLSLQRGYLQGYAAAMAFGVLAILLLVFV
jgi:NADH-quinone oxidoreductase subunit L